MIDFAVLEADAKARSAEWREHLARYGRELLREQGHLNEKASGLTDDANARWIRLLAQYAREYLAERGLWMTPDGAIFKIPTRQEVPLPRPDRPADPVGEA
jgi:hypothetical protein